jgi:hypothetical protein
MARVSSLDTNSSRPSAGAGAGDRSLWNAVRQLRMLRELDCLSAPCVDSHVNEDSNRSTRNLGLLIPPDPQQSYEELESQLQIERKLRTEAMSRAESLEKALEEAESKMRIEIELRVQAERKAREDAESRLEIEHKVRGEAEQRRTDQMTDTADFVQAEAITTSPSNGFFEANPVLAQALDEMMARVHAEQREIIEKRARAAAEDRAKNETIELVGQKRGVLHKVLLHSLFSYSRDRLSH